VRLVVSFSLLSRGEFEVITPLAVPAEEDFDRGERSTRGDSCALTGARGEFSIVGVETVRDKFDDEEESEGSAWRCSDPWRVGVRGEAETGLGSEGKLGNDGNGGINSGVLWKFLGVVGGVALGVSVLGETERGDGLVNIEGGKGLQGTEVGVVPVPLPLLSPVSLGVLGIRIGIEEVILIFILPANESLFPLLLFRFSSRSF
jgi:hypothetical protein